MDDKLYKRSQDLIKRECPNYSTDGQLCFGLDKRCPMMGFYKDSAGNTAYKMCSWFKACVLPYDDKLMHDMLSSSSEDFESKECSVCGKSFAATDGRQTTCASCRAMDAKMKNIVKRRKKIGKR